MVTESMLAVPPAVVLVTRMVLVPAVRGTEMDAVAQVSRLAVIGKFSVPREVPLTEMVAGRAAVVPSEYRKLRVLVPAVAGVAGISANAPTAVGGLAEAVPVKPGGLEANVAPAGRVAGSASDVGPRR